MLIQGVAIGEMAKELSSVSMAGIVEREGGLRSVNPLISLGGFWKHAGSLGVNDGIPVDSDQQVYYLHSKMRAMPHKRNEELVDLLSDDDVEKRLNLLQPAVAGCGGFDLCFSRLVVTVFKPFQCLLKSLFTISGATEASGLHCAFRLILCFCRKTHLPTGLAILECVFLDSDHIGVASLNGPEVQTVFRLCFIARTS